MRPDRKAFDGFRTQLQAVLDKIALERHEAMRQAEPVNTTTSSPLFTLKQERADRRVDGKWNLCLNIADYGNYVRTKWMVYMVDVNPIPCLAVLARDTFVKLVMLDSSGAVVTEDEFLVETRRFMDDDWRTGPLMRFADNIDRSVKCPMKNLMIAPFTMATAYRGEELFFYSPYARLNHRTKITLEELKRITDINCKIEHRPTRKSECADAPWWVCKGNAFPY